MTTIAFRDSVMASDRQAWLGRGETVHCSKTKIFRLEDGRLIGVSSSIVGAAGRFIDWYKAGADPESWPVIEDSERKNDFDVLVAWPGDKELTYYHDSFMPTYVEAEFFAIGSGAEYALGAMAAGCSAPGAVGIAQRFDPFSGHGLDILNLEAKE